MQLSLSTVQDSFALSPFLEQANKVTDFGWSLFVRRKASRASQMLNRVNFLASWFWKKENTKANLFEEEKSTQLLRG